MKDVLLAILSINMLTATLRLSTPLIYAAVGGVFTERSGVMNIALEGIMLFGAFTAVVGSYYTHSPWYGIAIAAATGAGLGLVHAWVSVTLKADQIISATAINLLAIGVPNFMVVQLWHVPGSSPSVASLPQVRIPLLADLPTIGSAIGNQDPLIYGAFLLVPVAYYVIFHTPWGLRLRAVGEDPRAADTAGLNVYRYRYIGVVLSGTLAAIGGAYLSVGTLSQFSNQMTQGRGFIALGAMIFGGWHPVRAMLACLLFGGSDALQVTLQAQGVPVPSDLLLALPYVLTLVALVTFVGRTTPPAAIGKPYTKG